MAAIAAALAADLRAATERQTMRDRERFRGYSLENLPVRYVNYSVRELFERPAVELRVRYDRARLEHVWIVGEQELRNTRYPANEIIIRLVMGLDATTLRLEEGARLDRIPSDQLHRAALEAWQRTIGEIEYVIWGQGYRHGAELNQVWIDEAALLDPRAFRTLEQERRRIENELHRQYLEQLAPRVNGAPFVPDCVEARRKARELLLRCLTKKQRAQYERDRRFDVEVPECSWFRHGGRVTITEAEVYNVLDPEHQVKYCAGPAVHMPTEDRLLAQKLVIENDPVAFFSKANRIPISTPTTLGMPAPPENAEQWVGMDLARIEPFRIQPYERMLFHGDPTV